jgi:hypothetical protein
MDIGVYDMVRYSKQGATDSNGIHGLHAENKMESTEQATTPTKLWELPTST